MQQWPNSQSYFRPPVYYAIVQLPGRKFPGIVFQGDSAHNFLAQLETIQKLASKYENDDLNTEIEDLKEVLLGAINHFEMICAREGIELPYPK